jgi:DMSO reductase anchor subunit
MHPAWSVILLTTLTGVGQGLFLALVALELGVALRWLPVQPMGLYIVGSILALAFLGAGLLASFFHLGRPERAWRAIVMWRTSWLSREVIVLPAFIAAVFAYGAAHYYGTGPTLLYGAVGVVLCLALFLCTGMIYACLKFLQEWHSPLTIVNFVLMGCASGLMFATLLVAVITPELAWGFGLAAAVCTLLALAGRSASLVRNARLKPKSSLQTAIGIKHPRIVQKAQGFMGGSFNTREFFHGRKPAFLRSIKWIFLLLAFPVPVALLVAGIAHGSLALLALAFAVQYAGLIAERWFFFAQARHPQNLYYQAIS